jgi:hypothetical protein
MKPNSLDILFSELNKSYIRTADFHLKNTSKTGYTSGMQLDGDWVMALPDPREELEGIRRNSWWPPEQVDFALPKWISLCDLNSQQIRIISKKLKNLCINKTLLKSIKTESFGLWDLYLRNIHREGQNQKRLKGGELIGKLDLIEFLVPNISKVAEEIVSEASFGKIKKKYNSIKDAGRNEIEYKKYFYISGIKKIKNKETEGYSPIIKNKDMNWASTLYPPQFPVEFNLTKTEATILVAHELFRLKVIPLLEFKKMRRRKCAVCNRNFNPRREIDWFGVLPPKVCSICFQMATNSKLLAFEQFGISKSRARKNSIKGVKEFEKVFGFIPSSKFDRNAALISLASPKILGIKEIRIIKSLAVLPRHETARMLFGSWAHLLDASDVLEKSKSKYGGYRSIGSDNHVCLSVGERIICEALTSWNIAHHKEPFYPFDSELNPKKNLRADFKVKNLLIEFAGRMSIDEYAEKMAKKVELAKKHRVRLIVLDSINDDVLDKLRVQLRGKSTKRT